MARSFRIRSMRALAPGRGYRAAVTAAGHFRQQQELSMSSIGLGTYLGHWDERTDRMYQEAIRRAIELGCNVIDSAINYRFRYKSSINAVMRDCARAIQFLRAKATDYRLDKTRIGRKPVELLDDGPISLPGFLENIEVLQQRRIIRVHVKTPAPGAAAIDF